MTTDTSYEEDQAWLEKNLRELVRFAGVLDDNDMELFAPVLRLPTLEDQVALGVVVRELLMHRLKWSVAAMAAMAALEDAGVEIPKICQEVHDELEDPAPKTEH